MPEPELIAVAGNGWLVIGPSGKPFLSPAESEVLLPLTAARYFIAGLQAPLELLDLPGPPSPVPGSERREKGSADPAAEAASLGLPVGYRIESMRALFHLMHSDDSSRAARALHLANWRRRMRHCPSCSAVLEPHPEVTALRCPACGLEDFPRISPAVIVLLERKGRILLARNARFAAGMHSLLAGFAEAGESLEETCRREVAEEVGVEISSIRYVASQPWPFPDSLMIGFRAVAEGQELRPDGKEIVEAGWFDPTGLPPIPRKGSIARSLIDLWLSERGFGTE